MTKSKNKLIMTLSYYSPTKKKENDTRFVAACNSFQHANYLEAANGFKAAYENNPEKKWFLMNYATSIRNAGHIDYAIRIYEWLRQKYPRYKFLNEIFNKTIEVTEVMYQRQNPCQLLNVPFFRSIPGYPQREYLVNEDFHNISISLCMIVKNEAKNIKRAIESVKPIVDEIIVVDTGSTDDTVEIAESLGANIYHFEWNDNFSEARNFSLKQSTKDWILILDADESISYVDLLYIKENIVDNNEYWGIALFLRDYLNRMIFGAIRCENDFYEESKPYVCYKTQQLCRLIKNSKKVYFSYPVYEIAEESIKLNGGEFVYSDIVIHHYGRLIKRKDAIAKRKYYIDILTKHLDSDEPDRLKAIYCCNIARAYSFVGKHKIGHKYLSKAIKFDHKSPFIYFDIGNNAMYRKKYSEAINWLEKAIGLDDRQPEYFISIAQAYMFLGDIFKAMEMMQRCLDIDPENTYALNFMSEISEKGIL